MNASTFSRSWVVILFAAAATVSASANTQLVLSRNAEAPAAELKGVIDLTVDPGLDDARVTLTLDGETLADGLRSPWKVVVDFGPNVIERRSRTPSRRT